MAAYRNYSDEDKAAAIAYAEICGNIKMAARECKIPEATLRLWLANQDAPSAPSAESVTEKREAIADRLEVLVHRLIDVAPDRIGDANLSSVMTAVGISVDKMRLLREQSTVIAGQVKTVEERDAKVQEIIEKGKLRLVS